MSKHKHCIGDYVMAEYYKAEFAKVRKQLAIAVEALKYIYDDTKKGHTQCDACGYCSSCETCINADWAEKAIQKIKELDNKNKIFTYMGKPVDALTYIEKKIEYERKELEK